MATTTLSYFVICQDFGRDGREAYVDPEMTRRGAVEKVREIIGDGKGIAFIHFISMNELPQDVTDELIEEACNSIAPEVIDAADRLAARFDHARDLRKHGAL